MREYGFTRKCPVCGTEFQPKTAGQYYCSDECRKTGAKMGIRSRAIRGFATEKAVSNMKAIADMVKDDPFYGKHQMEETLRRMK